MPKDIKVNQVLSEPQVDGTRKQWVVTAVHSTDAGAVAVLNAYRKGEIKSETNAVFAQRVIEEGWRSLGMLQE